MTAVNQSSYELHYVSSDKQGDKYIVCESFEFVLLELWGDWDVFLEYASCEIWGDCNVFLGIIVHQKFIATRKSPKD